MSTPLYLLHKTTLDLVVYGYCRSNAELKSKDIPDIPDPIKNIIFKLLLFTEYFTNPSRDITIKKHDPLTIIHTEKSAHDNGMTFGSTLINTKVAAIYEWTFKIINGRKFDWSSCVYYDFICIGLKNTQHIASRVWIDEFCEFDNLGDIYCGSPIKKRPGFNVGSIKAKFGKDSTIKMTLDLYDKTVSYCIDDEDLGVAFENIPEEEEYRMAVTVWKQNDSVSLIDFKVKKK